MGKYLHIQISSPSSLLHPIGLHCLRASNLIYVLIICKHDLPPAGVGPVPQDVWTSTAAGYSWEERNKKMHQVIIIHHPSILQIFMDKLMVHRLALSSEGIFCHSWSTWRSVTQALQATQVWYKMTNLVTRSFNEKKVITRIKRSVDVTAEIVNQIHRSSPSFIHSIS